MSTTNMGLFGTALAVGGGAIVAAAEPAAGVVEHVTTAVASQGQMTYVGVAISISGFLTAFLPRVSQAIELYFADKKNAREMARDDRVSELEAEVKLLKTEVSIHDVLGQMRADLVKLAEADPTDEPEVEAASTPSPEGSR